MKEEKRLYVYLNINDHDFNTLIIQIIYDFKDYNIPQGYTNKQPEKLQQ